MESWKTISKEKVLDYGKWLVVEDHTVELPDGRQIPNWPWVITPDYINVLAQTIEGTFLCFRQTKYSVKDGTSLGVVGGYIEPGEDPLTAAKRELLEEMGYEAAEWVDLGKYAVDGNRGAGTGFLFLAREARFVGKLASSDDLEALELLKLSREELRKALLAGEFKVLGWAACVALALQYT
jgi:ADP-ribose pyrophosphatase